MTAMLTLRRTGLSSPAYQDLLDYIIVEDSRDVGRLYEDRHSKPELRWFWSITLYVNPMLGITTSGRAARRAVQEVINGARRTRPQAAVRPPHGLAAHYLRCERRRI
jgi:hypothetical protein